MTSLAKGIWNMGRIQTLKAMLLAAFISVEMLAVLIAVGLLWLPTLYQRLAVCSHRDGRCIASWSDFLEWFVLGYKSLHSLLHPKDADRKSFYRWPDYSLLRYYGYIPLLLCVLGGYCSYVFGSASVLAQSSDRNYLLGHYACVDGLSCNFGDGCSTYRCFAWWC